MTSGGILHMEHLPAITVWYLNSTRFLTGRAHWERWNFLNMHDFSSSVLESTHSQSGSLITQVIGASSAAELGAGMFVWRYWDMRRYRTFMGSSARTPLQNSPVAKRFAVCIWTLSEPDFHGFVLSFLNRGKEGVLKWQVLLLCNSCRIVWFGRDLLKVIWSNTPAKITE